MFEVGFSELLMLGLVTLIVVGPQRLPAAARIAGLWIGKLSRTMATVKSEIQNELHAEDVRQMLQNQIVPDEMKQLVEETEAVVSEINTETRALIEDVNHNDKSA